MDRKSKHIFKATGWFLLALIFLLFVAGGIVVFKAEEYINKNLANYISEKSNQLYEMSFDNIKLNFKPLSISVTDISLQPNKEAAKSVLEKSPSKVLYSFHSSELKISDFKLMALLKNKSFQCKNISIAKPEFELSGAKIFRLDTTKTFDNIFIEMQPLFKKFIKTIVIEEINLDDANYSIYNSAANINQVSNAQQISVTIKQFKTDSTLIFNESRFFDSDDVLISMKKLRNLLGDSLHVFTIDTLKYSLKTSNIFASGIHLFHEDKNPEKNLYDVYVPNAHIVSKSISRLSINDSIHIQFLEFEEPQIRFFQKEVHSKLKIEELSEFDLYSLVENQFLKIKVDSFLLVNANLEIFRQPNFDEYQQQFQSVNISLQGFELDSSSAKNTERLFHAKELEMMVHGYHLRLEDKEHDFFADSMMVSTISNRMGTKNIVISSLGKSENKPRTQVNIDCKLLGVEDVDLKTLYHKRTMPTRNITVIAPNVNIQYNTEVARPEKEVETGLLFNLVTAYLKGVYSEVVSVENGTLNINNSYKNVEQGYFETGFNFILSGFALDSASIIQTDKFFYATNFDLQFTDYQMKLVDNLHKIDVDRISILSLDRKLQIDNLRLEPVVKNVNKQVVESFNRSEIFNIHVPQITLYDIQLREAFFYNKLIIDDFQITDPKIYYENFGQLRQAKTKKEFSEFFQLVFNYIHDFDIRKIEAPNGKFTWINHTRKGKTTSFDNVFSATLENFKLNENELKKQRLLFSDNFNISIKDQLFELSDSVHVLQAGEINLSTATSGINIKNAILYPSTSSEKYKLLPTSFQITIPEIKIDKFNFLKAYYSKELLLNQLELITPKIQVYSKSGITKSLALKKFQLPLPSFIDLLKMNELKVSNGKMITYETTGETYRAHSNFNIDISIPGVTVRNNEKEQIKITTQNLIATISDFKTPIGERHSLEFDQLDFNQEEKDVSISELKIIPFGKTKNGNIFSISAPKLKFTGFELQPAIEKNHFLFDEITVDNPNISIEISDSIKGNKLEITQNLNLYPYVEPYVDKIKIGRFQLENVNLNFNWFEKQLIDRRFNIEFKEIDIDENTNPKNVLSSKEFELSSTNFKTKSKNGLYEFTADSLVYNSEKNITIIKDIKIKPVLPRDKFEQKVRVQTDYVEANISFIELAGINENLWITDNSIDAKSLIIGKTDLGIFRNKRLPFNEKQRPPWPQDLIKEIKQPFFFDSVFILPSNIIYSELTDISDDPGSIWFNDFSLIMGKLSNIENVAGQAKKVQINARAKLMGEGQLNAKINFDLFNKNHEHSVLGSLSQMPMIPFNKMIEQTAPLSIESGQINRLDFDLTFNNKKASGELYFGYDDFKITIWQTGNDEQKKSVLASFWANNVVLNSKNPKGDVLLPVTISYERDEQRSIINYWWKAIYSGTKESLGIKPKN